MISTRNRTAPYLHTAENSAYEYFCFGLALIPCFCHALFFYGIRSIILIASCVAATVITSLLCEKIRGTKEYYDINAIVTGAVFAMLLPPKTSIILAVSVISVSEFLFKQVWGGTGSNPVSVASMARILIQLFWPDAMNGFVYPGTALTSVSGVIIPSASEIDIPDFSQMYFMELFAGKFPGMLGAGSVLLLVLASVYLLSQKIMKAEIPATYILTIALGYMIFFKSVSLRETAVFILTSGCLFAAVFLLGDIVTQPNGNKRFVGTSRCLYGFTAGLLTVILAVICRKYNIDNLGERFTLCICVPVVISNLMIRTTEFLFLCHHDRIRDDGGYYA